MNSEFFKYLQAIIILTDLLLLNGSLYVSCIINQLTLTFNGDDLLLVLMFVHTGWFVLTFLTGIYRRNSIIRNSNFIFTTFQVNFSLYLFILMTLFLSVHRQILMNSFSYFFVMNTAGLVFFRLLYFFIKKKFAGNSDMLNRVAILGYNPTALKLAGYLEDDLVQTKLIGFFANTGDVNELTPYPVLSDLSNAVKAATFHQVEEIFSTISPEEDSSIYELMQQSEKNCIRFKFVPSLDAFYKKPYHTVFFNDLPVLSPFPDPLDDPGNRMKKRLFDVAVSSLVCLLILTWLIPLLSILIYLESKGPVIFRQKRTGKRDKPFTCLKFRTMHLHQDKEHIQATKNDKRITRIGAFLRKTSLDEFPQFINVLLGNMSIVGPRPHMVTHTAAFSQLVDHYMVRQLLKPGITGWAQVNGFRGEITHPEQLEMRITSDIWYLQNWTLILDFKILLLTISGIFKGDKHAY